MGREGEEKREKERDDPCVCVEYWLSYPGVPELYRRYRRKRAGCRVCSEVILRRGK